MSKSYDIQVLVQFKVLLDTAMFIHLCIVYGCFAYNGRVEELWYKVI